jgi:hypothetical protein
MEDKIVHIILVSVPGCHMLRKVRQLRIPVEVMPLFINQHYMQHFISHLLEQ